ncbi:chemotaxis protein CheB [Roseateles sp. GG27B]
MQTLKAAARSRPQRRTVALGNLPPVVKTNPGLAAARPSSMGLHGLAMNKPVLIGSSTGGTLAIEQVLLGMPADSPGIAIVQHMPEKFTAMYAQRLDSLCAMNVREARDGDRLERGVVLIAPGGRHMQLRKAGGQYFVVVLDGPPVNRHKPSVDVLFRSAAECAGKDVLAIILTGMGDDGARGMLLHDRGARTIAQNEQTCVVFGMPKEAIQLGAVDEVLAISQVSRAITAFDARG